MCEVGADSDSVLVDPINGGGTLGEEEVAVNFFPEDMVHSAWSLLGRATTVIGANRKEGDGRITEGERARVGVYQGQNSAIRRTIEAVFQGSGNLDENHRPDFGAASTNPTTTSRSEAE